MIERQNILDLFGADKNKYHSCIITAYSFDFLFFEQRVLPRLRRAGMININVFVDSKMYQQQLSNLDGRHSINQSYSIIPIKLKGAFHPKILMGFGKNNGFLAIGSGNLTSSGLSSNDEVWGACHTYRTEGKSIPIFNSTYKYLKKLQPFCLGSNLKKWEWPEKNTSWLSELPNLEINNDVIHNNEKLILISSFSDSSMYNELLENLPSEPLENITIISPYYNKNGQIITNLINDLKPKTIDIVIDSRFGTVPYKFSNQHNVQFHEWSDIKLTNNESSRLHAKIFQFKYPGHTCVLTGSANATKEALGTKTIQSKNAEMNLFIKADESKNWIQELKIEIPKEGAFDLSTYQPKSDDNKQIISASNNYDIHAEVDLMQLFVYVINSEHIEDSSFIEIKRSDDTKSNYPIINPKQNPLVFSISESDAKFGFRISIFNNSKQRISGYAKIHNTQLLLRTNPDVKSSRIFEILNGTELKDDDLIILLEFANFNKATTVINSRHSTMSSPKKLIDQEEVKYNKLNKDEFNQNDGVIEHHHKNESSNLTMLEDFLNNMVFDNFSNEDFSDSNERAAEEAKETGTLDDEGVVTEQKKLSFHEGQRIRSKIHSTLKKIHLSSVAKHQEVLKNLINILPSKAKASAEDLKKLLVGTHLIFMKYDESFKEERIKFIIKYNKKEYLSKFETIKGINLKRLASNSNLNINEVAYDADAEILNDIDDIISKYKGIKLVYKDETPSKEINHVFFKNSPLLSKKGKCLHSKKGFLIHTISPILLLMANGVEDYNTQELIKFNTYKKRLFYRVLVLLIGIKWSNNEIDIMQLFMLNVFYQLMPDDTEVNEVLEEIRLLINNLNLSELDIEENINTLTKILNSYNKFMQVYKTDKGKLLREINRNIVKRITFKSKLGFAKITSINNNGLNVLSPLGFFNNSIMQYEIRNIKTGSKAIIY